MGRKLTVKQKKYLANLPGNPYHWDDIDMADKEALEKMNDSEVLWMNASRFLSDLRMEERYGNK